MASSNHVVAPHKVAYRAAAITFVIAIAYAFPHWHIYFGAPPVIREVSFSSAKLEVVWAPRSPEPRVVVLVGWERAAFSSCRGLTENVCASQNVGHLLHVSDLRVVTIEEKNGIIASGSLKLPSGETLAFENTALESFLSSYHAEVSKPVNQYLVATVAILAFGILLHLRGNRSRRAVERQNQP